MTKSQRNGRITARQGMDIIKRYFPERTDQELYQMLWNNTGWPAFWSEPPRTAIHRSMRRLVYTYRKGKRSCDFCSNPTKKYGGVCRRCEKILKGVKDHENTGTACKVGEASGPGRPDVGKTQAAQGVALPG